MSLSVKVSGTYKTLTLYHKVGGVWKELALSNKVSGVWKALTTIGGGGGVAACSIDGSLSATGTGINVIGPSRPVTVPSGNSGKLLFRNFTAEGYILISVASAGAVAVAEEDTLTWTNTQSITVKATGLLSGEDVAFDIYDFDTNTFIQNVVVMTRS